MTELPQIGFGTSGLRGPAEGFQPGIVTSYVGAFLEVACGGAASRDVLIGADLRASSPAISAMVASAVAAHGWTPIHSGNVPTPALASSALKRRIPAIMVTGSHIPPAYNGLKFYRPDGELLKSDEAPIRAAVARQNADTTPQNPGINSLTTPGSPYTAVRDAYNARYISCFAPTALSGLRVGIFQHSAVGRDVLPEILAQLGAGCIPFGRSGDFIAVDTEAVGKEHLDLMRKILEDQGLDAVVSTDGDGDRPLVLDETGSQINGDVLGALTARFLGADCVVTPLNSTGALEKSVWFQEVIRTRIGSPYVVEAMDTDGLVVGFEANGGFLVGTDFDLPAGRLERLPTRDAVLPIVAVLAAAAQRGMSLSALAVELPKRVMKADRLKEISPERGGAFVKEMARSPAARAALDARLEHPVSVDTRDGTRLSFADGSVVHFRQSGNAPELRCYVETDASDTTDALLQAMMRCLMLHFERPGENL